MIYAPGLLSANEIATGLLVRGIKISGEYAIVERCTIFPQQDMDEVFFIQGGPRSSIANIGNKYIEGEIVMPLRVDADGVLDPAAKKLLDNAENPDHALTIETNHVLSILGITADNGGTDSNALLTLDCCVIESLLLNASPDGGIKITAKIVGMIDTRTESELIAPPEGFLLRRQLSFADCDASRLESDMRTISSIEVKITNEIEKLYFLMTLTDTPYDQPYGLGVKSCKWTGSFEEVIRMGSEMDTYIHGGFMVSENLQLRFGPITALYKVPMFKIGEQPLTNSFLTRKTEFFGQTAPAMRDPAGDLFIYQ